MAGIIHTRVKEQAEVAYNLSHANIVNTLSHETKRFSSSEDGQRVRFKLYMIQARPTPHSHCTCCRLTRLCLILSHTVLAIASSRGTEVALLLSWHKSCLHSSR